MWCRLLQAASCTSANSIVLDPTCSIRNCVSYACMCVCMCLGRTAVVFSPAQQSLQWKRNSSCNEAGRLPYSCTHRSVYEVHGSGGAVTAVAVAESSAGCGHNHHQ